MNNGSILRGNTGEEKSSGFIYRFLRLFTVVHPGEAVTALLLAVNIFLVITSYSILKPVRAGLFLAHYGADTKAYLAGLMAIIFIFFNKMFGRLASKVPRQLLITFVTLFFISNLVLFYILDSLGTPLSVMGPLYYVWLGIFNVMVIAQFWAFANDLYTEEAGKRLFPMIMVGQNIGALTGVSIAYFFVDIIGLYPLMLLGGAILGICIALTFIVHKRETERNAEKNSKVLSENKVLKKEKEKPLAKGGGFRLVFKSRYLLYIALLILLLNLVNTTGEYIRDNIFKRTAEETVQVSEVEEYEQAKAQFLTKLESGFGFIVNLLAVIIQLIFVSRIFKWIGVRGAILILPMVSMGANFFIASLGASLAVVMWAKAFENSTDYSLMNACRAGLFLITSREDKYKAKAVIDTFFVRTGDLFTGIFVFVGTTYFAFTVEKFAIFNVAIAFVWMFLCILIIKEHKKLSDLKAQRADGKV